jgi:molybdenum cofactor cytidylyltransferase
VKGAHSKIACVILAAGEPERFEGVKHLARIKGMPMLQHSLNAANGSGADYVLLVIGSSSTEILSAIDLGRAQVVLNKNYKRGVSTSVKVGIANMPQDCKGAIIMVADQPFLKSFHLNRMMKVFRLKNSEVVILSHKGEPRSPVLISSKLFHKLVELKGDTGARQALRKRKDIELVEISDDNVFFDIDTRREYTEMNRIVKERK